MMYIIYQIMTDHQGGGRAACLNFFLKGLSLFYGLVIKIVNYAYDRSVLFKKSLNKPVISIGNITLGGVGKTPLVIALAQYLKALNVKPVILTRGYKSRRQDGRNINDEILLLQDVCPDVPVVVGANRFRSAQTYLQEHEADIFIMDDGFQHRKLMRDLDVVVLDATNPFGNGALIPRGILREPFSSLTRADFVILTKVDKAASNVPVIKGLLHSLGQGENVVECVHAPLGLQDIWGREEIPFKHLEGQSVCLVSAIGDPKSFEDLVKSIGYKVSRHFIFRDHYWYIKDDIDEILSFCKENNIQFIIMTQKDSVKIRDIVSVEDQRINILSLNIFIDFLQGKEKLYDRIHSLLQR